MVAADGDTFEVAVVGAGVSGLTVAWLLSGSSLADRPLLLLDGARDDDALRTLSFWTHRPTPLEPLVRHRWRRLRLEVGSAPADVPLVEHTYCTLFFADLQREAKARFTRDPAHRVVDGRLDRLEQDATGATLHVGDRAFRARWVLDSRFHLHDLAVDPRYHALRQHFRGWIVRAPHDAFDPSTASLLDFRVPLAAGTGFCYVLPFTTREALVELVSLHPLDAGPILSGYLRRAHGLDRVEILDREAGVSPMTEQPFDWRAGPRVRRIGVAAGRLKPSTGYALTRIVEDSTRVVSSLERDGHPFAAPPDRAGFRLLDGVLLELWDTHPDRIPGIFEALFTRNPADRVLRFLDERAPVPEVAALVATLPPGPFLRAAARWSARRVRLAARRTVHAP